MQGRSKDFMLMPNDVLFVPAKSGRGRKIGRALLYATPVISTMTWMLIR
jgi:hypothetical protein